MQGFREGARNLGDIQAWTPMPTAPVALRRVLATTEKTSAPNGSPRTTATAMSPRRETSADERSSRNVLRSATTTVSSVRGGCHCATMTCCRPLMSYPSASVRTPAVAPSVPDTSSSTRSRPSLSSSWARLRRCDNSTSKSRVAYFKAKTLPAVTGLSVASMQMAPNTSPCDRARATSLRGSGTGEPEASQSCAVRALAAAPSLG